eukprot:CAMPEP_0204614692 /NCGR_PEP_ID=MMETSP0717-20131115/2356_1 /ASSEMBLY_ACC=CAM_ASM_000666 /TAXON_ID=230516 /ORGANISM="Chaetoceros curvisetus" /LENGTH=56 /DNA_ID=CAMNT_0051627419 /DNA_START=201 /DNA_END=367 /DNA_ORIENTATION=-
MNTKDEEHEYDEVVIYSMDNQYSMACRKHIMDEMGSTSCTAYRSHFVHDMLPTCHT